GAKKGFNLPSYPTATCNPADAKKPDPSLPKGPDARDALGDLPDAEDFETLRASDEVATASWGAASAYAREMRCLDNEAWHFGYVRSWRPGVLTSSARTRHTEISRRRFASTTPGTVEPISRFYKLAPDG